MSRILLHVFFIFAAAYVADRVLFPVVSLVFSFDNINSIKNNLISPRLSNNSFPDNGVVGANQILTFNANPLGNFSSVQVSITTDSNSKSIEGNPIILQKSYQAFFYPLGEPMGFKTGSLLTTADGNYYIISDGLLRKFASADIISQFGYNKDAFQLVSNSDLSYNKIGPDIVNSNTFPNDTLFAISDSYYQLKNQQLVPFISQRAFLSQYNQNQAITKDNNFLSKYPASNSSVGFANGTLASSNQSAFLLSNGKSYPFLNPITFISMGYDWNNIIPLQPEELGLYEAQKRLNLDQPHPDGTIFQDRNSQKYFVIENNTKRPIESQAIAKTYNLQNAIIADLASINQKTICRLKKQSSSNTYSCDISLLMFKTVPGDDFQISAPFATETKIKSINTSFFTPLTWPNLRDSLSNIKGDLKNNYSLQ